MRLFLILLISIFGGCVSALKTLEPQQVQTQEEMGPPQPFGPSPLSPAPLYGPEPSINKKLVVVFSPGLARSFAAAGVLKALHKAHLPIETIVASDIGAYIATAYVISPSLQVFEWILLKTLKYNQENIPQLSNFKKVLLEYTEEAKRFHLKILDPTQLTLMNVSTEGEGSADWIQLLEKSLDPTNKLVSNVGLNIFDRMIQEAELLNQGPVLAIQLDRPSSQTHLPSTLILTPRLHDINPKDFGKKADTIYRGELCIKDALPQIKELLK